MHQEHKERHLEEKIKTIFLCPLLTQKCIFREIETDIGQSLQARRSDREATGAVAPPKLMYGKRGKGKDLSKIREREKCILLFIISLELKN